jgi:hypothetical protein
MLWLLFFVALGFLAGYSFSVTTLIALTLIAVWIGVYLHNTSKWTQAAGVLIYDVLATIAVLIMWVTYVVSDNQHWISDVLGRSMLR